MTAGDWKHAQRDLQLADKPELPPLARSTPLAAEARLAQALREAELEPELGPKRKHHRKRK